MNSFSIGPATVVIAIFSCTILLCSCGLLPKYDRKYFEREIAIASKKIAAKPNDIDALRERANSYVNLGETLKAKEAPSVNQEEPAGESAECYKKAIMDCDKLLQLDPGNVMGFEIRGTAYHGLGQLDRALEDYSSGIKISPVAGAIYMNRAMVYAELGRHDDAIKDYTKALDNNSICSLIYSGRGEEYRKIGEYDKAIQDYNRALNKDSKDNTSYTFRGMAYADTGDYKKAIQDYDKSIQMDPSWDWSYTNRGIAYEALGDNDNAIRDYSKAIELYTQEPRNHYRPAEAYHHRAQLYAKLGKTDLAKADEARAEDLGYRSEANNEATSPEMPDTEGSPGDEKKE